jgi:predicted dehydrogenase
MGFAEAELRYVVAPHPLPTELKRRGVVCLRDWRPLLEQNDLDGVLIVTPAATHFSLAAPFLQRGLPLFIEKPLALNWQQTKRLWKLWQRRRGIVMVGHLYLFHPVWQKVRSMVRRWRGAEFMWAEGMQPGPVRKDIDVLGDWAVHDIALALDLWGEPRAVRAWQVGWREKRRGDMTVLQMRLRGGIVFQGSYSWRFPYKRRSWVFSSRRRVLWWDNLASPPLRAATWRRSNAAISNWRPVAVGKISPPLSIELRVFVRAVQGRSKPSSTLAEALPVMRVIETARKSISQEGKWLPLLSAP